MAAAVYLVLAVVVGLGHNTDAQMLNIVLASVELKELSNVSLNCTLTNFTSVSHVTFTQTWQGKTIQSIPKEVVDSVSTLQLDRFTLQDAGIYGCQVEQTKSGSIDLSQKVEMAPRLMSAAHDVVYAEVDTRTALSAAFLNVSTVLRSKWSKDGKELDQVGQRMEDQIIGYRMHRHQVNVSGSRLSRTWMTTSSDFGYYYVTACTRGGCTSASIELKQLARPQPPIQFQVVDNFTDGFWFTWRSQFNGGGGQRFEVSYKRSDSTARGWAYKKIDEDPGVGHTVYGQISGLEKNTGYDVRVQAISTQTDSLKSNFTEELVVFVEDPVTSSDIGVGAGIGIGITVALLVAGLCLAGYYVWRTKRTNDPLLKNPECSSDIALPTQNSTLSSQPRKNSNPYNATEKPNPVCPLSPSVTRPSMPRPPVPGSHAPNTPSLPRPAAPLPSTANTRKKDKSVALPSPPPDEMYEAVETEPDGGEYVAPMMHYQNM